MTGLPCEDGSSSVRGTGQYAGDDLIQRMDPFLSRQKVVSRSSAGFPSRHRRRFLKSLLYPVGDLIKIIRMAFEVATLTALESN